MADISKIKLPSGNEYDIKDAVARQMISGGVSFNIVWTQADYESSTAPTTAKLATIPAGAIVGYNNGVSTATGTLVADGDPSSTGYTPGFYLTYSKTQAGNVDKFDEFVTITHATNPVTYSWERIGDTQIDLSNVVTDVDITSNDKSTTTVIGSGATLSNTQPTIALATDSTSGTGKVQVATGITSVTDPTISLSAESSSATGRAQFVQSISTTKAKATVSGGAVGWDSKDTKTVLTGVQVTTQPSVSLTANDSSGTGRIQYVQSQGSATTTKLSATASISGKTSSAASSVTPTTKKLALGSVTGVSGSTNITPVESRSSQTTVSGFTAATTSNYDSTNDILKGASVTNEVLSLGAYKPSTQTTYSAGAPRASLAVPTAASSATTVATGSVTTTGSGADIVTDVAVGDTVTVVTAAPTVTIASGSTGDVTVATGINSATTKYLSAGASGTAVGANGTANVIGNDATISYTEPGVTLATGSTGDITVATGGTQKYMQATASGTAVTPTQTYIKGTASGGGAAWNNKDQKTVLTDVDVTVTKGGNQ